MTMWFGDSWGAPVCDPEEHCETPVGRPCLSCGGAIASGDQGFVMPHVELNGSASLQAHHRKCFLKTILGHGPDCEHCRGHDPSRHDSQCAYRLCRADDCNCSLRTRALQLN